MWKRRQNILSASDAALAAAARMTERAARLAAARDRAAARNAPSAVPAPSGEPANPTNIVLAQLGKGAAFVLTLGPGVKPFRLSSGMTVESASVGPESGIPYIRLGNGPEKARPIGVPDGFVIKLPDDVEQAASGRRVGMTIVARAHGGETSRFAVAYSTNDVGNSGWRWHNAGPDWSIFKWEYQVPPMRKGNGDYVALLAGVDESPATDFCCFLLNFL